MPTFKLLLSQEAIAERVRRLGDEITRFYEDLEVDNPVLVPVLDGSLVFCADLMRAIRLEVEVCPVTVKSYQGTESGAITHGPLPNVPNRCVLIIEDVVDTGNTLRHLMRGLIGQGALHIATCVFLDKRKVADFAPTFHGFAGFRDSFVLGYGMDFDGKYRNLPDLVEMIDE